MHKLWIISSINYHQIISMYMRDGIHKIPEFCGRFHVIHVLSTCIVYYNYCLQYKLTMRLNFIACMCGTMLWQHCVNVCLERLNLSCGTVMTPELKLILKPNRHNSGMAATYSLTHLLQSLSNKSSHTLQLLASSVASLPATAAIPSSRYIILLNPCALQYFTKGCISLVNK